MKKIIIILICFLFKLQKTYSQTIDNFIKNEMVTFLYINKEYNDKDIAFLKENSQNKNQILFWVKEIKNNCETDMRIFKFGTSTEHTKTYILLLKNSNEKLFLGTDFQKELDENLFYQFIKFYKEQTIACTYSNIYYKEILPIYESNRIIKMVNKLNLPIIFKE